MLSAMFSGRFAVEPDENGEFFIDRNGRPFVYILDYLRNGELDVSDTDEALRRQILREATFYNLIPLINILSVTPKQHDVVQWSLDATLKSVNIFLSNKSLTAVNIDEGHAYVMGNTPFETGQHAWKLEVSIPTSPHWILIGISRQRRHKDNSYSDNGLWGVSSCSQHYYDGVVSTEPTNIKHGDTVYVLLDADTGTLCVNNITLGWRDEIRGIPTGVGYVPHFNLYDKCSGFTLTPVTVQHYQHKTKRKWKKRHIKGAW
eukprot:TRINITY_DN2096_c1_g1_i2.p1 TRINITY_DN2096_c1_g1~~TRINITY_DN2096_c1_g1_i2.p1  ORF type:complete len:260 (-),score=30.86 TRINITY_DN2096_c1_g1_i2:42-821(-)